MRQVLVFIWILTTVLLNSCQPAEKELYEPTWESLIQHEAPQWFLDAKFGIFIHWGVYAVPAYHEWYLEMYSPKSRWGKKPEGPPFTAEQGDLSDSSFRASITVDANEYHRKNFGAEFDYDDFIPEFKAENYDPENWASLFKDAGAKYVVMTAKHGEEFAMWPSKHTPRNSMDMGPHRDLAGDLLKAVRAEGMKMGFYHNTTYTFYDPRFPDREWVEYMNNSIKELIDLYHPDILWGDVVMTPAVDEQGETMPAEHFNSMEVLAYFYNQSPDPSQVLANDRFAVVKSVTTESLRAIQNAVWYSEEWHVEGGGALLGDYQTPERRLVDDIFEFPWETCDALDPTSWGYNRNLPDEEYMSTNQLVDNLVDIVSKNGNLLINVGPRADGTIPEAQREKLIGAGEWLGINGEAIYGTRYWEKFGEGGIRFTTKGDDILYAISLVWPGETLLIESLKDWDASSIKSVRLLGNEGELDWTMTGEGLVIRCPEGKPCEHAFAFKITLKNVK